MAAVAFAVASESVAPLAAWGDRSPQAPACAVVGLALAVLVLRACSRADGIARLWVVHAGTVLTAIVATATQLAAVCSLLPSPVRAGATLLAAAVLVAAAWARPGWRRSWAGVVAATAVTTAVLVFFDLLVDLRDDRGASDLPVLLVRDATWWSVLAAALALVASGLLVARRQPDHRAPADALVASARPACCCSPSASATRAAAGTSSPRPAGSRAWADSVPSSRPGIRAPGGAPAPATYNGSMQFRYLGRSGLKVSEITYGNWLTHGSQVENEIAKQCVQAALDAGITTFDTADAYANTKAETVLGEALAGERRESLEIFTKVYFPTGPAGPNDSGLSRKHILESINGSLTRLKTDYVDLYQAHRYDFETPLEETMQAFADVVRQGKALYIGVSEWTSEQLREAHTLATELGVQLISNQPQYSMLWRVIEPEVVPTSKELGIGQIVWSPIAQGVLTGKYAPGQPLPEGSRATDEKGGADMISRFMNDRVLTAVQELKPVASDLGLSMAQLAVAWVLQNDNVSAAIIGASKPEQVHDNAGASGVTLDADVLKRIDDALGDLPESDAAQTQSPEGRLS